MTDQPSAAIRLSLLFSRMRWQLALHEAMLEHQVGVISEETMLKVEIAERCHRELHAAILETL